MKIFHAMASGTVRSLRSWKGVLLMWFLILLMVSLIAMPMKNALKTGFGKSMITELFSDGINIEAIGDLGEHLASLRSYFSAGLILLILINFLLNTFLTGGLFNRLKDPSGRSSVAEFLRTSAKYFWSFSCISLIISLIVIFTALLVIFLPVGLITGNESSKESTMFLTGLILFSIFSLCVAVLLPVADYARAWQVKNDKPEPFKALGFGFRSTFSHFLSAYPMLLIIIVVQVGYLWLVIEILGTWRPATGWGVFLLFITSQILFFFRILLKTWRYGSFTALMDMTGSVTKPQPQPQPIP